MRFILDIKKKPNNPNLTIYLNAVSQVSGGGWKLEAGRAGSSRAEPELLGLTSWQGPLALL